MLYAAANVVGGVVAAAVVVGVWSLVCSGVMFVRACVCVCMCEYVCVCVVVYYDYLSNLVRLPEKTCAAVSLVSLLQRIVVTVVGDNCVGVVVAVVAVVGVVWSGLIWSRAGACVCVCVRACALLL